jgi:hypothetical protein
MKPVSYDKLKESERELEQLKGRTYSLEDQVCEVMKDLLKELEKTSIKVKTKKKKENNVN